MKNLEDFGVQEMKAREIKSTSGGGNFAKAVGWFYGTIGRYYLAGGAHTQYGV